jgi:hypothetical protein
MSASYLGCGRLFIMEHRRRTWAAILTCLSVSLAPRASGQEIKPGARIDYKALAFDPKKWEERKLDTRLVPWEGKHLVFLTTGPDFNPKMMGRFLSRLEAGWNVYADLVGQSPRPFTQLNGKPTIAAVPDAALTCGYGCGYIGATGIEVAGFYATDYPLAARAPKAFSHYYFYEMGRNYYLFGDRHSLYITGYAVFMRYVCMDALKCDDPDANTRRVIEACEPLYAASDLPFLKGFTNTLDGLGEKNHRLRDRTGQPVVPSDQPVIYAAAMLKLRKDYGGNAWVKRFFAALAKCPEVKPDTKEGALRQSLNWLVAASAAARKDLTPVFVGRWRFPLARRTQDALKQVDWSNPDLDPAKVIASLPVEFKN